MKTNTLVLSPRTVSSAHWPRRPLNRDLIHSEVVAQAHALAQEHKLRRLGELIQLSTLLVVIVGTCVGLVLQ